MFLNRWLLAVSVLLLGFGVTPLSFSAADASAVPGRPAPTFHLKDNLGNEHALSQYRGKYVVLEWVNYGCPFVGKHYRSGNMQELQKEYTGKGVVWLSICSSAPGKQGYYEGKELTEKIAQMKAVPTAYLVDAGGNVGRLYDAKATPTMAVINPEGVLVYEGGIDDIASTDVADIPKAHNFVREVLDAVLNGKPAPLESSRPYGCSVKY
jgi:peroxiredoxin